MNCQESPSIPPRGGIVEPARTTCSEVHPDTSPLRGRSTKDKSRAKKMSEKNFSAREAIAGVTMGFFH